MKESDFHLSRVHAAGWNAARHFPSGSGEPDDGQIDALNPHKRDPERARWLMGFHGAIGAGNPK